MDSYTCMCEFSVRWWSTKFEMVHL